VSQLIRRCLQHSASVRNLLLLELPQKVPNSVCCVGQRACLGRKFGMTESVAFLTLLLRGWKVEPLLWGGETKEQWRDRVLDAQLVITLGVADMPIRFTRRD
jgi:hypothetical protein